MRRYTASGLNMVRKARAKSPNFRVGSVSDGVFLAFKEEKTPSLTLAALKEFAFHPSRVRAQAAWRLQMVNKGS